MSFLVIRARSDRGVTRKIRETMAMLNLTRVNHATIVMDNPSYRGMLQKSKDYITWGEVDAKTIEKLIKERGRMSGDKPVTDSSVKEFSNFNGIKQLSEAIASGEATMKDVGPQTNFQTTPSQGEQRMGRNQEVLLSRWCSGFQRRCDWRLSR